MPITALYAGLLGLLLLVLSVRVIASRRSKRVEIGDGGDKLVLRRMRAQANFVEYVPMTLLLMALAENLAAPKLGLHAAGLTLLIGRLLHPVAIARGIDGLKLRAPAMMLTFFALALAALLCLARALQAVIAL